jgi:hypothetical protein
VHKLRYVHFVGLVSINNARNEQHTVYSLHFGLTTNNSRWNQSVLQRNRAYNSNYIAITQSTPYEKLHNLFFSRLSATANKFTGDNQRAFKRLHISYITAVTGFVCWCWHEQEVTVGNVLVQDVSYSTYLLPLPPVHCRYQYTTTTTTTTTTTITTTTNVIIVVLFLSHWTYLSSLHITPSLPALLYFGVPLTYYFQYHPLLLSANTLINGYVIFRWHIPVVLRSINVSKEVSTYTTLHYEDD